MGTPVEPERHAVVVVMLPLPLQSHLNQLLQLSYIVVSSYDIPVHYVGSALHNSQVQSRSLVAHHNQDLITKRIKFHDFPTPQFVSPPPNPNFPSHVTPCFEAVSLHLRQPFNALLTSLSTTSKRVVVIHDPLMSSVVQDAASLPNSEFYMFYCISAISQFSFIRDSMGLKDFQIGCMNQPEVPYFEVNCSDSRFIAFLDYQTQCIKANVKSGYLYNTCRLIENSFLEFILEKEKENDEKMKLWAVGPLETVTSFEQRPNSSIKGGEEKSCLIEWLNKQEPNSVLYISFGTTAFLEDKQIRELAIGLEQSGVKFIWVLREADKADIFDDEEDVGVKRLGLIPDEFEERVKGLGMVVKGWVPQLEILGHPSIGGFMSHCGWNSCLESISLGVPLATWPMHSDQPLNAFLITEFLKVGLVLREWEERNEIVSSEVIKNVVKRLMVSDEGNEIRKRAEELGGELRQATAEGGVSRIELHSFIAHITR